MREVPLNEQLEAVKRMDKDIRNSVITDHQARFLVDGYYAMQANRIRANNQLKALQKDGEPVDILFWLHRESEILEKEVAKALNDYSKSDPVGVWSRKVVGIGPVLAAGLLAHIDMEIAKTAGNIWNFAGLNPGITWGKGEKRPFNASLKVLCWKIGESFVKSSGHENSFYGPIYRQRKEEEVARNEAGEFKDQAAEALAKKNYKKTTDAYKAYIQGKLPPAHVNARAKRYAVKMFLAHWHEVAHWHHYGTKAPEPYAIVHLGHAHKIDPPHWDKPY